MIAVDLLEEAQDRGAVSWDGLQPDSGLIGQAGMAVEPRRGLLEQTSQSFLGHPERPVRAGHDLVVRPSRVADDAPFRGRADGHPWVVAVQPANDRPDAPLENRPSLNSVTLAP